MEESIRFGQYMPSMAVPKGDAMSEIRDEVLPLDEVAASLKASKRMVYRLAQKGEIPAFKLGGTWRFRRADLERWIAECIHKQKPEAG